MGSKVGWRIAERTERQLFRCSCCKEVYANSSSDLVYVNEIPRAQGDAPGNELKIARKSSPWIPKSKSGAAKDAPWILCSECMRCDRLVPECVCTPSLNLPRTQRRSLIRAKQKEREKIVRLMARLDREEEEQEDIPGCPAASEPRTP